MAIIHCWIDTSKDEDSKRRRTVAAKSWAKQLWKERPIEARELPRLFKEGDKSLPFVGDIMDIAVAGQPHDAIIVHTNADIIVLSDVALRIAQALQHRDVCYSFRRDFHHRLTDVPRDRDFVKGQYYPGSDLHAFRVRWWTAYRAYWPPLLLGREAWDWCFRILMEATCMSKPLSVDDLICHERHANGWENPAIRYTSPSQRHNLALAKKFLARYHVAWNV